MTIRRNLLLLLAVSAAASCASNSAIEASQRFLDEDYVLQAFEVVEAARNEQLADGGVVDPELEAAYQDRRFRMLHQRGRLAIYADREPQGVEYLQEALTIRPGDARSLALIERAKRKLATRSTQRGQDLLAKSDLEGAIAAFAEAQTHVAGWGPAQEGIEAVRAAYSRLHSEAQKQFLEAIRKLPQFRFSEVDWHATAALARDKTRVDAQEVQQRAQRELAEEARQRAEQNRAAKKYGAALMDFRTAGQLWPEMPGVQEFIAQMEVEVQVVSTTERAQLAIKAGRLDEAKGLLDEAFEKSTLERGTINELRYQIRRKAGETAYQAARDLELQGMKAEAAAAFEAVVAEWPDGLLDEQTRLGALKTDMAAAATEFAAGEAKEQAADLPAALEHYKAAKTYYEKYRDTAARVERLTKKLAEGGSGS